MFVVLIAFLSPVSYALCNVLDAHISNNVFKKLPTLIFYNTISNLLIIPFLFLFGDIEVPSLATFGYIGMIALIEVAYLGPYYLAIRKIDTSVAVAMFSLGRVMVPILAYLMIGEKLSIIQYCGYGIIIFFNVILGFEKQDKIKVNSGFWLMLLSSLLLSVQVVTYKKVMIEINWISLLFWNTLLVAGLSSFFTISRLGRQDIIAQFRPYLKKWKFFLGCEIASQFGNITAVYAISILPVVVFEAIDSTQALWVLAFGLLLNCFSGNCQFEKIDRFSLIKKIICFIFIIFGVVLAV